MSVAAPIGVLCVLQIHPVLADPQGLLDDLGDAGRHRAAGLFRNGAEPVDLHKGALSGASEKQAAVSLQPDHQVFRLHSREDGDGLPQLLDQPALLESVDVAGGIDLNMRHLFPSSVAHKAPVGRQQPVDPCLHILAGLAADRQDLHIGIQLPHPHLELFQVKIKQGLAVQLGHQQEIAHREHQRVLQDLVVPHRHAQQHDIAGGPCVKFRRADQISHILQKQQIHGIQVDGIQRGLQHGRINVAVPAGADLYGQCPSLLDLLSVHHGLNVRLHHTDAQLVPQPPDRVQQQSCLTGSGRGHHVDHEGLVLFQPGTQLVGQLVIFRQDLLLDVNILNCHWNPLFQSFFLFSGIRYAFIMRFPLFEVNVSGDQIPSPHCAYSTLHTRPQIVVAFSAALGGPISFLQVVRLFLSCKEISFTR